MGGKGYLLATNDGIRASSMVAANVAHNVWAVEDDRHKFSQEVNGQVLETYN